MQKNILIVLLSSLCLAGCTLDLSIFGFGNNNNNNSNNGDNQDNDVDPEGQQQQQTPTTDPTKPTLDKSYTANISLAGADFCTKLGIRGQGFQINANGGAANKASFESYLEGELLYNNLLISTACVEMNSAPYRSSFCICIGTRNDNNETGFDQGTFTWNSGVNIYKVEVKARGYYKTEGAKDTSASIFIDSDETSLSFDASSEPPYSLVSKEYASGTKTFSIKSSEYGRITLESISITWGL